MCFFTGDICASGTNGRHCLLLLVPWAFFFGEGKRGAVSLKEFVSCFFFVGTSMSEHENSGKISELYRSLCGKEQEQSMKNPEIKSVYAPIFDSIRSMCMTFQNEINSAKIHLPKAPPKQRRKSKLEPVE